MANFTNENEFRNLANKSDGGSGINEYVAKLFDASLTWRDVEWLIRWVIITKTDPLQYTIHFTP